MAFVYSVTRNQIVCVASVHAESSQQVTSQLAQGSTSVGLGLESNLRGAIANALRPR